MLIDVDDRGAPLLSTPAAFPPEQRLVHPHGLDMAHPRGIGLQQRFAPSTAISIVYKTVSPPWGINGGKEAEPNHIVIDPGTENEERKGGSYNFLEAGQVLANNTGGGGGWGNPFERDPALVAKDVRNGFVSVEAAERDYGVAVDPATFSVDTARTATLRE